MEMPRKHGNGHSCLDSLCNHPVLSQEEIEQLCLVAQQTVPDDATSDERGVIMRKKVEARNKVVVHNQRLVADIAKCYLGRGVEFDDLVSEGNFGLMHAVEMYDPSYNTKFSTYASYWIKKTIGAAVRKHPMMHIPFYLYTLIKQVAVFTEKFERENGYKPSDKETSAGLGLSLKRMRNVRLAIQGIRRGDLATVDNNRLRPSEEDYADELAKISVGLVEMEKWDKRVAGVVQRRFGEKTDTLRKIGEDMGLTREQVRQIEADGLRWLQQWLGERCVSL
jgi:RNA polymerase primary sigma factor